MNFSDCWYKEKNCKLVCSDTCTRYSLVRSLFKLSHLPEAQWPYKVLTSWDDDLEAFTQLKEMSENIIDFVNEGHTLYIWSNNCGNGKTSWAIRLMWAYFDKIWHISSYECKAVFVNVQKFLHDSKANISYKVDGYDEFCNDIQNADLVIWDDLPCASFTDFEHQLLFQFIDERINWGKANIVTGNENKQGCFEKLGDKLTSRLFCDYVIELKEGDKRGLRYGRTTDAK